RRGRGVVTTVSLPLSSIHGLATVHVARLEALLDEIPGLLLQTLHGLRNHVWDRLTALGADLVIGFGEELRHFRLHAGEKRGRLGFRHGSLLSRTILRERGRCRKQGRALTHSHGT